MRESKYDVHLREGGREFVAGIRADPHEAARAERQEARIAGEEIEADGDEREDQERDEDGLKQEIVAEKGQRIGERDDGADADAILTQRKDRHIGGVAYLVLPGLAIEH